MFDALFPRLSLVCLSSVAVLTVYAHLTAQQAAPTTQAPAPVAAVDAAASQPGAPGGATTGSPALPRDYVIGVEDVLNVVFWSEKELSAEVVVRPDGKISLPMLNDITAVGLTPEQLAASIQTAAAKFVRNTGATVLVRAVNSRKFYVIGEVAMPGSFPLGSDINVMQAIAQAGGFLEHAKKGDVVVVRMENGQERRFKFNYNDVLRGKKVEQNIVLRPGDTVLIR